MRITIVGGGIGGLASAWALTKRGNQVELLEQADTIPNPLAASGDQHRIIRRGYGTADGYASLITEAFDAWDELWADLGANHYVATGIMCVCQHAGDEADVFRAGYDRTGVSYQRFEAAEAVARYPFLDPSALLYATLTPEGGALLSHRIATDLVTWLRRHGAMVRAGVRVDRVDPERGLMTTEAGETIEADRVLVTAGAWSTRLAPHLRPTLRSVRTQVAYVVPPDDLLAAWRQAACILSFGGWGDTEAWAIPPVRDTGMKFGAGIVRREGGPDGDDPLDATDVGAALLAAVAPPLARIDEYRITDLRRCVYTFTADECFFAEARGRTTLVSACSGHGYKFGAAVGRRVAAAIESGNIDSLRSWLRAEALPRAA